MSHLAEPIHDANHQGTSTPAGSGGTGALGNPWLMLGLATLGFVVNFWAWALLSPLGPRFKEILALSASQQALLVAVPVIVGSLGRIPVGALTDNSSAHRWATSRGPTSSTEAVTSSLATRPPNEDGSGSDE